MPPTRRSSLLVLIGVLATACGSAAEPARRDRANLLQFHDADGAVHTISSAAEWKLRREDLLRRMQTVMGPLSGVDRRVPLNIETVEIAVENSYIRRLITYQTETGSRTPAYLCVPKRALEGGDPVPAVLCLHPTDNLVGHQVVVGLGGRAGRQYAAELAERGYTTLSPAYPHLANYWPNLSDLGYSSGTMKAIWDNVRALDLLGTLPYVDTSRGVGAIGHSLGGHNAIYSAVFDERISVIVSSCGFDAFPDYYDGDVNRWYFGQGWCQIRYMPRLSDYRGRLEEIPFDFPELLAALAPRPVFINAPLHDDNFRWQSVERCVAAARPVYDLMGHADVLEVVHPDCDHNFPDDLRERAYQVIDSVLRPDDPTIP